MLDEIQKEYLDNTEHSQKSKEKIADYINEASIRGSWLAKKINDLKLPGAMGITYRVKSDYSIGNKVRLDKENWKELSDFIGLTIVAPTSTFEYLPKALENIKDLDIVSSSCFSYTLNCRFMDFPVEVSLLDYKTFALKQFDECVRWELGKHNPVKLDLPPDILLDLDDEDGKNDYEKAFKKFISHGRIVRGCGRFSVCYPSVGDTNKPVSANFEDGFEADSAFSMAFLTNPSYSHFMRFGILSNDDNLKDLAFMAYKGVPDDANIMYMIEKLKAPWARRKE